MTYTSSPSLSLTLSSPLYSFLDISYEVDFNTDRNWHAITNYSHFILGCGFFLLAILLTLKTWQIRDYTNREDVKQFIMDYIQDRWFLRGGVKILGFMIMACAVVVGVLASLYAISQQNDYNAPPPIVLGTVGCVCLSAILGIFFLGTPIHFFSFTFLPSLPLPAYFIRKAAEAVFVQYVSQNVNYTSAIILKRVVKSKVELAIVTVVLIFLPVIYTLFRSLMSMLSFSTFPSSLSVITDWNDNHAMPHRIKYNFNTPCYFDAFPPYTMDLSKSDCPNYDSASPDLPQRNQGHPSYLARLSPSTGFYDDVNILSCDSVLGISFYSVAFVLTLLYVVIFVWFISNIIRAATKQLQTSRWYDAVASIVQKYLLEHSIFQVLLILSPAC